jgi:FAD/FMN-containing dehydrogenase
MNPALLDELKALVGEAGWTSDPAELEPHLTEWRDAIRGATPLMLMPASTAEVSSVLQRCHLAGVGVVPQGGNTGLCGGAIPDTSGEQILLSLSRMRSIRQVNPADFSMVVDCGCVLADIQSAAREAGLVFPLSLAAEGSCQIGGNLSTNAGGLNVIRYGTARDQVLGLEVVLADGTVWNGLRTLRKDTAWYDMKQVFIGSEGTLGIITGAALKLYPDPGQTVTTLLGLDSCQDAVRLLAYCRQRFADHVQAFELISERCFRYVVRHIPGTQHPLQPARDWYALVEVAGGDDPDTIEEVLCEALEAGLAEDAIVAKNVAEADKLWRLRHSISEAQKPEGACLKHDISVPVGRLAEFLDGAGRRVAELESAARPVIFGHVGDGNLHYNIVQPAGADPVQFRADGRRITEAIYELATGLGGSISAEHGIGVLKKADLGRYRDPVEIELMRTLKKALDPRNILNPGKVI